MAASALNIRVEYNALRMLIANIPLAAVGSLGCALVLYLQIGTYLEHSAALQFWLAALASVSSIRVWLVKLFRRAPRHGILDIKRWWYTIFGIEGVLGILWGSLPFIQPGLQISTFALYLLIIAGLSAGAAVTFSVYFSVVAAFIIPSQGLASWYLFYFKQDFDPAWMAVVWLYGALMLTLAYILNKNLIRTITSENDKRTLIVRLKWINRKIQREMNLHRRTSAALQISKDRYESVTKEYGSVLENMPIGVVKMDAELRITYLNLAMEKMIGVPDGSHSTAIGELLYTMPTVRAAKLDQQVQNLLHKKSFALTSEYVSTYNKKLYVSVKGIPIIKENVLTGALAIVQDISEQVGIENALRLAKDEAESASRAKSIFLTNMSHELRTPLHGILGMVDVLEFAVQKSDLRENLNVIRSSGLVLLDTVNRLLDISRIESGNFPLVFETCNLHEEIENIVELHRKVVLAKGLSFDLVIQAEVPNRVTVDMYRLRHILQNLLNNAYKFTAQGGISVLLSANDLGGKVYAVNFSVKDTGIGISELDQKRLFDPFVQLENGTTRRYQGVGLGSTIAREMVRQMGGELHVLSTQGQGSTFHFTLNLRAAEFESPSKAASGAALPVSSAVTTKVLVVDDNEVNRMIAVKLLEKEGCEVDAVASGLAAISHARDRIYDLVFMDIDMPEMDGIETAKHLREGGNKSLPIIAMTAHTLAGDRERLLEAGMDDYVAKPFDRKIFANIVKKFKDNPHSTQYRSAK